MKTWARPAMAMLAFVAPFAMPAAGAAPATPHAEVRPTFLTVFPIEPQTVGRRPVVTLHLADDRGDGVADQALVLSLEGEVRHRARTGGDGTVSIGIAGALPVGAYRLDVVFTGSATHAAAVATARLVVRPIVLTLQTVPPTPGVRFSLEGHVFVADEAGTARVDVLEPGTYALDVLLEPDTEVSPGTRARFGRWADEVFQAERTITLNGDRTLQAGFASSHQVALEFVDLSGTPVPHRRITSVELTSSNGAVHTIVGPEPVWLPASRVQRRRTGLEVTPLQYSVTGVLVDGANVVNRYQQRFYVAPDDRWSIAVLLYGARLRAVDAVFGTPVGTGVVLEYPDGRHESYPFAGDGSVQIEGLARGLYKAQVVGARGVAPLTPVALSRFQDVELKVLTALDIALGFGLGLGLALGLLFYGRPHLLAPAGARSWRRAGTIALVVTIVVLTVGLAFAGSEVAPPPQEPLRTRGRVPENTMPRERTLPPRDLDVSDPIPLMAYYYIWFDTKSWDRAKTDYPLIGRYDSDDRAVMEQHVRWAKEAGLTGFIVSWKSTLLLDRRLEQLIDVAEQEDFWLWIMYQGLDFARDPLPIERIDNDLEYFIDRYARSRPFGLLRLPVVVLSGSWAYAVEDVARLAANHRDHLYLLASERSVHGYQRLAHVVDGNAYYWSSVDVDTFAGHQEKLTELGDAVHQSGGLWIAPAAPGFDARRVGGTSVVERLDGQTLRRQLDAAARSSPDAIAVISWNEFSENTHVEPSVAHGTRSLEVLADGRISVPSAYVAFDSSEPGAADPRGPSGLQVVAATFLFIVGSVVVVMLRHFRPGPTPLRSENPPAPMSSRLVRSRKRGRRWKTSSP